jgi:transcriptional regulator with XRE-family HTH domain
MIKLGKTARYVRDSHGLTQRAAAELLGISVVHLCNIENNKATPSQDLLDKFQRLWGVDLYVLAWCLFGDVNALPSEVREASKMLGDAWTRRLERTSSIRVNGGKNAIPEERGTPVRRPRRRSA